MSGYAAVPPRMFDPSFTRLSPDGQRLEFYLRTCPQRNSEGLFRLRWGTVDDDLGITRAEAKAALAELIEAGRPFVYDPAVELILDKDALRTQPLGKKSIEVDNWDPQAKHDNRLISAMSRLRDLPPSTVLLKHLYVIAEDHAPELAQLLLQEFPRITDPLSDSGAPSEPLGKPLTKGRVETETDTESRGVGVEGSKVQALKTVSEIADQFPGSELVEPHEVRAQTGTP